MLHYYKYKMYSKYYHINKCILAWTVMLRDSLHILNKKKTENLPTWNNITTATSICHRKFAHCNYLPLNHALQVSQTLMHQSLVNAFTVIKDLKYAKENISFCYKVNLKAKKLQKSITADILLSDNS